MLETYTVRHKKETTLPDFIGIGTPKAATSWIFRCLTEHPNICDSVTKETHFLLQEEPTAAEYSTLFQSCPSEALAGEFSTKYLYSEVARKNIKKISPDTKLILCLRNPIERAVSLYYYRRSKGRRVAETIEQQLEKNPHEYLEQGRYFNYLSAYSETFPSHNILVLIYEDIEKDPVRFIKNIYYFLNVDDSFIPPSIRRKENVTAKNKLRFPIIRKLLLGTRDILVKLPFGKDITTFLKHVGVYRFGRLLLRISSPRTTDLVPLSEKPLSEKKRAELRKYFQADNEQLERFLGRDLSFWN